MALQHAQKRPVTRRAWFPHGGTADDLLIHHAASWLEKKEKGGPASGVGITSTIHHLADAPQMIHCQPSKPFHPVPAPRPLPLIFYCSASGNEPVRDWLKDLPADERRTIGEDIKTVQFRWPLGMPLVDSLGDGLWEVRTRLPTRIARTLFFVHREEIILLHGFIKKTQRTPTEDRALALKRKHAYIQNSTR